MQKAEIEPEKEIKLYLKEDLVVWGGVGFKESVLETQQKMNNNHVKSSPS